ncbi:hypothetical protein BDQ17DRAFT_1439004 [Cyathus striatus]|nr:hypothetical protein BDQ17DRAFT_1439004 [Cyathus striatus]
MSPSLVKALVKRTRRPERVQANAPLASRAIFKRTSQPEGDVHEDQPASSSSHVDNIISHSSAALKIMEGLLDLAGIPALKVVSGALARFLELVDQMRKNKDDYIEFSLSVFETIKAAKDELIRFQESLTDLENFVKTFGDLETELLEMVYDAERLMNQSFLKKVWSTSTTKDTLQRYQGRLNRKISIFTLRNTMVPRINVEISNIEETIFGDYNKVILGQMELLQELPRLVVDESILPPKGWHENEYSVRIGNDKKTARFYEGTDGIKVRLKGELEIISRFRHPRLGQLYGICRSTQRPALIFHQELRDIEPYRHGDMMTPMEHVYFTYDCFRAYVNAREYLISQCDELLRLLDNGVLRSFVVNLNEGSYAMGMDMRMTTDGRIILLLSVANPLPVTINEDGDPVMELRGREYLTHKIYPTEETRIIATTSSMPSIMQKLKEFHSIVFAVGASCYTYIGHDDSKRIRCRQTVKWGCELVSYSNPLDFTPAIRIAPESIQSVGNSNGICFDIIGEWIRFSVPCFETSQHNFDFTITPDMRNVGNVWVAQMPYAYLMLEEKYKHLRSYGNHCAEFLHPSYWTLSFQAEYTKATQRTMALPSMIYLFVSVITETDGRIEPEWYWSWHVNGIERLSLNERLQAGILGSPHLEASLKTERIVWGQLRLDAIRTLHESYGFRPDSRDAAKALGLPIIQLSIKEKRRSRSISRERVYFPLKHKARSSSTPSRIHDIDSNILRRHKKSGTEYDYWTELCLLHNFPSTPFYMFVEKAVDTKFKAGCCHLKTMGTRDSDQMPNFFGFNNS